MPDRVGQIVRNQLLILLNPRGRAAASRYRLVVELEESIENLAFQQDDTVTRKNLRLTARFNLHDISSDTGVLRGATRSIAAYNVVRSDYANLISERDARDRAAQNVAEEIKIRLAVYFSRQRI